GRSSLWQDEALTVHDALVPFPQIHQTLRSSGPVFHYIVKVFEVICGKNDFWLRFPAALFGVVTIPLFYTVLRKCFGKGTALWGGLLLVFSPAHILYSQELRMYSLAILEVLAALYFLERLMKEDSLPAWTGLVITDVLGLYTHNWFLFFTASQAI